MKIITTKTKNRFTIEAGPFYGGMGTVYKARREKDGKLYALKTIRIKKKQGENNDNDEIKRLTAIFKRESLIWIILGKHKNIVSAYWFDITDDYLPLLIMQYIEGRSKYGNSLRKWLDNGAIKDIPTILAMIIQALTGLIHAQKMLKMELDSHFAHRDLTPNNLLIDKNSVIKVTDFGLAKAYAEIDGEQLNINGGTPGYMAPERLAGEAGDERSDIYALGCVLDQMRSSRPFYQNSSLNQIISTCLNKDKTKRFSSYEELRDQLQHLHQKITGAKVDISNESEPLTAENWKERGVAFDQLGYHKKAIACCNQAIELAPRQAEHYLNRGTAYCGLELYGKAMADYKQALELDAKLIEAWLNLGHVYAKTNEYRQALAAYDQAEKVSALKVVEIYIGRGNMYAKNHQYDEAVKEYNEALVIDSANAEIYFNLGNVYYCDSNYIKARDCYEKSLEINHDYKAARQALEQVAKRLWRRHSDHSDLTL